MIQIQQGEAFRGGCYYPLLALVMSEIALAVFSRNIYLIVSREEFIYVLLLEREELKVSALNSIIYTVNIFKWLSVNDSIHIRLQ